MANELKTEKPDIAARAEHHADAILRAAGSGLRHYTLPGNRRAIILAALDCYEEAYRAGADFALRRLTNQEQANG